LNLSFRTTNYTQQTQLSTTKQISGDKLREAELDISKEAYYADKEWQYV